MNKECLYVHTSEVRGSSREYQTVTAQELPRGATRVRGQGGSGREGIPSVQGQGQPREELPHVRGQGQPREELPRV